ncbi:MULTISPECIES: type I 3-dehydroquinate dehydratase [Brevibacterium]|uniref:3-dehydroquinate dehydratase n=1 Tax=Brevibacterium antiquum CNRZ 918 TaxID=1255637 RepID=A0A2H1KKA4_9MICO|nr:MULTISPECIES: type I 3-dehydroquinate dehydratase [Brevibacterium]SMY00187.1 3-dehydroquinate dehydratase [Brevibacterium antiquum CNRZ 918]
MKQLPFLNDAAGHRVAVDPRRPAIIVPVQATAPEEIARQCRAITDTGVVDVIEWRIDPVLASIAEECCAGSRAAAPQEFAEAVLGLAAHVSTAGLPVLITLRTGFEGGSADVSEDVYTEILTTIITGLSESSGLSGASGPAIPTAGTTWALDVEIDRRGAAELIDMAHDRGLSVVASHHNFARTDSAEVLGATFTRMAAAGADVAKIAMMPGTRADVAELLRATALAEEALAVPVLGISMGQLGRTSRVMGADFGSCATFAQLGESSAPGQIAVADLAGIVDRLYG